MFKKYQIRSHALEILYGLYQNLKEDLQSKISPYDYIDGIPVEDFNMAVNYLENANYISNKEIEDDEIFCKITAKGIDWVEDDYRKHEKNA